MRIYFNNYLLLENKLHLNRIEQIRTDIYLYDLPRYHTVVHLKSTQFCSL